MSFCVRNSGENAARAVLCKKAQLVTHSGIILFAVNFGTVLELFNLWETMQASLNALASAGRALLEANAKELAEFTVGSTRAVGPTAPPGSVLHLGFFWYVHSAYAAIESRSELIVTATLESQPGVANLTSARTVDLMTLKKSNPGAAVPAAGLVLHGDHLYAAPGAQESAALNGNPMGRELAIIATAVIADLYAQLSAAQAAGPVTADAS